MSPMYTPTLEQVKELAAQGNLVPIYREIQADLETPVSAFLKVARGKHSFLLESVEGGERLARYSFIGTQPYKVIKTGPGQRSGPVDPLRLIEKELARFKPVPVPGLPRFLGGAVGYLSYEVTHYYEPRIPAPASDPLGVPESVFLFTDTLVVFDHLKHVIKVISHVHLNQAGSGRTDKGRRAFTLTPSTGSGQAPPSPFKGEGVGVTASTGSGQDFEAAAIEEAYGQAVGRIEWLAQRLRRPLRVPPPVAAPDPLPPVSSAFTKESYMRMVERCKEYVVAGDIIQVVPSQRLTRPTPARPFDIYRALRAINPSPYMYFLHLDDFDIVGASPEALVRVEEGAIYNFPLAGTRRRGATPEEDEALAKELRTDEKERAEHIMLVDLGRNDVGRVSEAGSVRVTDLMRVVRYSHVMHLESEIQGRLRADRSIFDALRACIPAGTLSGAPKIRAMEIIAALEPVKRGPYSGAVGYFGFDGNMDTAIAIRTLVLKDGVAYVQAGGGIVYDSVPELEYQETLNKALAPLRAIEQAERAGGGGA